MCDCKTRLEKLLTERHAKQNPADSEHSAKLMGYGVAITGGGEVVESISMPVELRSTTTVKKTGAEKRIAVKSYMHFSHCPFCGEKRT